ncbi:MAG: hypothetical protein HYZ45_10855 [Burkholderiales bacterium]|nr:hypothetical protein [Burkholderiales bacterium]
MRAIFWKKSFAAKENVVFGPDAIALHAQTGIWGGANLGRCAAILVLLCCSLTDIQGAAAIPVVHKNSAKLEEIHVDLAYLDY